MTSPTFASSLAHRLSDFVQLRRLSGTDYSSQARLLCYWDRFLCQQRWESLWVTRGLVERYLETTRHLHPRSRFNRLCAVRQFCRYLRQFEPLSHVPGRMLAERRSTSRRPYILALGQIQALMAAAGRLSPPGSLRPDTYRTLLGLLYATGLRISEAFALDIRDADPALPGLQVREGKFRKARWVPLSAGTARALQAYIQRRARHAPAEAQAPLFVNQCRRRLCHPTVYQAYRKLLLQCGIRSERGPGPCLHDLRHSFAVSRLLAWYREGRDVNALLPALATYMGHVHVASTQVYLQATAELLEQASQRFADHFRRHILNPGRPS